MATEKLTAEIDSDTRGLLRGLAQANAATSTTASRIRNSGKAVNKSFLAMGIAAAKAGAVIAAAGFAASKAWRAVGGLINNADKIGKLSEKTGLSVDMLQRLETAAGLADGSIDSIDRATRRMAGTILDASKGMATAKDALSLAGIELPELEGKSTETQLLTILKGLSKIEDKSKRLAIAEDIFGRSGGQLLPMLKGGVNAFSDLLKEREKLGPIFTQEQIESAEKYNDAVLRVKTHLAALIGDSILNKLPALTEQFGELHQVFNDIAANQEIGTFFKNLTTDVNNLGTSFGTFLPDLKATFSLVSGLFGTFFAEWAKLGAFIQKIANGISSAISSLVSNRATVALFKLMGADLGGSAAEAGMFEKIQRNMELSFGETAAESPAISAILDLFENRLLPALEPHL